MADNSATILIPDISGFTEFMTTTELAHASYAINLLIDAMVKAVGEEYEVSEIEGDAVLLIKKGSAPSHQEILDTCLKIFNSFHFMRKWIEQHHVCPCGACETIGQLTLKFVAHHGPVAEIKVGRFVKQSGTEMIIAHRLLKNNIGDNEYLLVTEKLLQQSESLMDTADLQWSSSSEEYASIGKVDYRFALLHEARKNVPEPPEANSKYQTDDTPYLEVPIAAGFRDVYMVLMNIPGRSQWQSDLLKVEQDRPEVFVGSIHHCSFENFEAVISPMRMTLTADSIIYAESCSIEALNISLVHEFIFKKINDNNCLLSSRFMNAGETPVPEEIRVSLDNKLKEMVEKLKEYCEKTELTFFEPAFQPQMN